MAFRGLSFNMHFAPEWDKPEFHHYDHWLFGEQSRMFLNLLSVHLKRFDLNPILGKRPFLYVDLRSPDFYLRPQPVRKVGSDWHFEYPVSLKELQAIPFQMEQHRLSHLLGETGDLPPESLMPVYEVSALTRYLHDLTRSFFEHWQDLIELDPGEVTKTYEKCKQAGYRNIWVAAKKRMPELNAVVELEFDHGTTSMRKSVVTKRRGEVIDRKLVLECGPMEMDWARNFKELKVDGRVITVGHGTWQYEIFGEAKIASLAVDDG